MLAGLLLGAMYSSESRQGRAFGREWDDLFLRWRGSVEALAASTSLAVAMNLSSLHRHLATIDHLALSLDAADEAQGRASCSRSSPTEYLLAVEEFCTRWRLRVWWAVPAVVSTHLLSHLTADATKSRSWGPLPLSIAGYWDPEESIKVTLSGTITELVLCVGPSDSPTRVQQSMRQLAEKRGGRRLTKIETRALNAQVSQQLRQARASWLRRDEWEVQYANLPRHAQWAAERLLHTESADATCADGRPVPFQEIALHDQLDGRDSEPATVRKAVGKFLCEAGFESPLS